MSSERVILVAIDWLGVGFPSFRPTPETLRAYIADLADLDGEAILEAARELRKADRGARTPFFPSIGEWRATAERIQENRLRRARLLREQENQKRLEAVTGGPPTAEQCQRARELVDDLCERCGIPSWRRGD